MSSPNPSAVPRIAELLEIPDRVHPDDFVLRLTEGVGRPTETLASYVVTPQLAECFDRALELIQGGLAANSSKAAYLHGSFGSGKSHFMAVLHLLLQQNPAARALEGLAPVVTRHEPWLAGKRFLLVPYHMIGQRSMEAAVLGGYVRRVRELHPEAPPPGVYLAEGLLRDARNLRERLGDEGFFGQLGESSDAGGGGGWGELSGAWDAASFEAALDAAPGSEDRSRLVGALIRTFFQGYEGVARGSEDAYVSLDDGLALISQHARDLGYDGLVLFLDELILWLATHASDFAFLNEEGPKVSKLVEAERADRPIPIVSFVARQRDLRDLVGDKVTGADQLGFAEVLQWWEARFQTITLEDRNLPEIAARRVLRPRSEAARQQIDTAFRETERIREESFTTLLTPRADRSVFRKVYPFSPALVEVLVSVSALLQRERTALRVMLQLLVEQRETLQLGEIVPVGDLFDVIADGNQPFVEGMRQHFENARRLYQQKLLPLLEASHGVRKDELGARPEGDAAARAFRADDRIVKTLLLAALVPDLEVLRGLTAPRLAALNHGSIRSPIPGREGAEVLRRVRTWAAQIGEIRIGDDATNPTIALQLSSVDTETILANAQTADNTGNRRRKIRELLFQALGVEEKDELQLLHELVWRGTRRSFEIVFANVRELPDESFTTRSGERKIVIDFPFDEPGHTPRDDLAKLADFRQTGQTARTLVWLPSFLSETARQDLGKLVKLDHILAGDRFRDVASHLSVQDQAAARELLRNQQSQLRQRVVHVLMGAYGVDGPPPGSIDESHAPGEHFQSLDPAFTPQPPIGASLRAAFEHLLGQLLTSQYPAHPEFAVEADKIGVLRRVHEGVASALQDPEGRVPIERSRRAEMLGVAVPLRLGTMGETHFVIGRTWFDHFDRRVKTPITVAKLRAAIDEPTPMGLPVTVQNLLLLVYADQANLSFRRHGGPWKAALESLPDDVELRPEELPSPEAWTAAAERAGKIFGIAASPLRSASNASELSDALDEKARACLADATGLWERLAELTREFGIEATAAARLQTAEAVLSLLRSIEGARGRARVEALAQAPIATSLDAMGMSYRKAAEMREALERTKWELFDAVKSIGPEGADAAGALRAELAEALAHDEYAVAIAAKLSALESRAIRLLTQRSDSAPAGAPSPSSAAAPSSAEPARRHGHREGVDRRGLDALARELAAELEADADLRLDLEWKLVRRGPPRS